MAEQPEVRRVREAERWSALRALDELLDGPMLWLALIWLVLLGLELSYGLHPVLSSLSQVIWALFGLQFAIEFVLAPRKLTYLRRNWLTAVALVLPALRLVRIASLVPLARLAGVGRAARLVNVVESLNRGRRALRQSMQRRGAGYVMALTVVVLLVGGAGIYAFEGTRSGGSLPSYADAVYFTLMLLTTIGSEFWPATAEGKLLTVLLGIYAIAVFGYVTATLATYFVGRDAESEEGQVAGVADLAALRTELAALRDELRALRTELQ